MIHDETGVMLDVLGTTIIREDGKDYNYLVARDGAGSYKHIWMIKANLQSYKIVALPMSTYIDYTKPEIAMQAEYSDDLEIIDDSFVNVERITGETEVELKEAA